MTEKRYCTQMSRNINSREYHECTQGRCMVKHQDCYLIEDPAQSQPKEVVAPWLEAFWHD